MPNNENKIRILFLSASDRINYGDLLFPIICKEVYKNKNVIFENYGIIKTDLSHFGALPTNSYSKLKRNVSNSGGNILVGGGEVLFANWQVLLSYLSPTYNRLIKIRNFRRMNRWFRLDEVFFNKTKNPFPFIFNSSLGGKVFYNAVGGFPHENLEKENLWLIKKNLNASKFLSVRDRRTLTSLQDKKIKANLVPDSAIILSDIFPKESLDQWIKDDSFLEPAKSYLFVQVGKYCAPERPDLFINDLEKLGDQLNLTILLCPIGLASGHEDQIILRSLSVKSKKLKYYHPNSIYEIMKLIAFSDGYIGTSLHGLITAQSYGIPFVPLNRKLKKVESYCRTWTSENIESSLCFSEIDRIPIIIENWNFSAAEDNLKQQMKMVYENFEEIWKSFE